MNILTAFILTGCFFLCQDTVADIAETSIFGYRQVKGSVTSNHITEASGIAASRVHNGVVYVHNDKGNTNTFFAVRISDGHRIATFTVSHAVNYDWEDIAIGPCADDCARAQCSATVVPHRYCIFLADTGDHRGDGGHNIIYMVREPSYLQDQTVDLVDTLAFSWSEHEANTLMIAPDGRLFIVSRSVGGRWILAQLPRSAWGQERVPLDMSKTAALQINSTMLDPQGGDISPDGTGLLLVAHDAVYYFNIPDEDYIYAVRNTLPDRVATYHAEPDTEAICWASDGNGFYVIAEGNSQNIYFYPKLGTVVG